MNNGINLVVKRIDPKQLKIQRQNRLIRLIGFGALGVFTLFSIVLFIFLQSSPITDLRKEEEAVSQSLNSQNEKIQNELLISRQLTHINEVLTKRSDLPNVVTTLLSILPPTISVSSYQAVNGFIELSVESSSLADLEVFFDELSEFSKKGELYGSIMISDITYAPGRGYTFAIALNK